MNEQTDLKVTRRNVQFLLILVFDKSSTTPTLAVGISFASVCAGACICFGSAWFMIR